MPPNTRRERCNACGKLFKQVQRHQQLQAPHTACYATFLDDTDALRHALQLMRDPSPVHDDVAHVGNDYFANDFDGADFGAAMDMDDAFFSDDGTGTAVIDR